MDADQEERLLRELRELRYAIERLINVVADMLGPRQDADVIRLPERGDGGDGGHE